ncbi:MAG: hypothetical protein NZ745_06760 [Candidatus Calescibacterium sp.]|nr:hypothetical protein [Candidatus Calescibacterium sp.]
MQLSENQKKAIVNAFCSEISYVQGPPGTGKSHTIIAIALLGIIKRKKVLIVSHKEPAVRVINDKIKNYIDPNFQNINILPYIYVTRETKKKLEEEIQNILDFSNNTSLLGQILTKMNQEWQRSNQELKEKLLYIEKEEKKKEEILNKMEKHYELHKEIEKLESDFFQRYYKEPKNNENNENKFITYNLSKIKKLCSF